MIACACVWLACGASVSRPDPVEPPAEVADGGDYAVERADSLAAGEVEVGLGYVANDGHRFTRRRHALFRADSLDGSVRDGPGDALAGAALEGATGGGRFGLGRGVPGWGRGLVLGDPREPWARRERSLRRRSAGDVAWYRTARHPVRLGAWAGSLPRRTHAGLEAGLGTLGVGVAGNRDGDVRASAWWSSDAAGGGKAFEVAVDRRGRWRAEAATVRRAREARLEAWVRAGHAGFRTLGDPRRAGPPAAVSVRAEAPLAGVRSDRVAALGALWRFAPAVSGARAMLEVEHAVADRASVVAGIEEQHGTRRDPAFSAGASSEVNGFHQGAWTEWRGTSGPVRLAWREERWGERAWARGAVRVVGTARVGVESGLGLGMRVTHAVYRTNRGEHVYLPEAESDRLVLRALAGTGERTRLELRCPFAGGTAQAALTRTLAATHAPRLAWTVEWTRRARLKGEPRSAPGS